MCVESVAVGGAGCVKGAASRLVDIFDCFVIMSKVTNDCLAFTTVLLLVLPLYCWGSIRSAG